MSNTSISLEQLRQAIALKEHIAALEIQLAALLGGTAGVSTAPTADSTPVASDRGGVRTMGPEARARIAAAQKARWAKFHADRGNPTESAAPKKRNMSPEGKARMVAAVKARWAKYRKAKAK